MTYRCYIPRKFNAAQREMIDLINAIINEYAGIPLSVRQVYYQCVARGAIPNGADHYARIQGLINNARLAGEISWEAIEDRGRWLSGHTTYDSPLAAIKLLREKYKIDVWAEQPYRVEVHFEKAALEGVIGAICDDLRVNYFATKGYNSQSEQWKSGRRLASYIQKGQRPIVLHLADHDPAGIDMTRDTTDRLAMFAGYPIQVIRIALTMNQIEAFNPPPFPAKETDTKAAAYVAQYGEDSWEMDALDPAAFKEIIEKAVSGFRDDAIFQRTLAKEAADNDELDHIIEDLEPEES